MVVRPVNARHDQAVGVSVSCVEQQLRTTAARQPEWRPMPAGQRDTWSSLSPVQRVTAPSKTWG
jgi:hypothetical protein